MNPRTRRSLSIETDKGRHSLSIELFGELASEPERTCLAIHGFGDNHLTWNRLRTIVTGWGWSFLSLELPGFGQTPLPPWFGPSYFRNAVQLVLEAARNLGPVRPVLVGNSLGASLALGASIRDAQGSDPTLSGAALLAPATARTRVPPFIKGTDTPAYRLLNGLAGRAPESLQRRMVRGGIRFLLGYLVQGRPEDMDPAWLQAIEDSFVRPGALLDWESCAQDLACVLRGEDSWVQDLLACADRVRVPTWVVRGEKDPVVTTEEMQALVEQLPMGRGVSLPSVGHCPQMEAPEATARLVSFLGGDFGWASGVTG